jgi:hypothetical protein
VIFKGSYGSYEYTAPTAQSLAAAAALYSAMQGFNSEIQVIYIYIYISQKLLALLVLRQPPPSYSAMQGFNSEIQVMCVCMYIHTYIHTYTQISCFTGTKAQILTQRRFRSRWRRQRLLVATWTLRTLTVNFLPPKSHPSLQVLLDESHVLTRGDRESEGEEVSLPLSHTSTV